MQYPTAYTDDQSGVVPTRVRPRSLNAALQADRPVAINPAATAESEFGTVADPSAPAAPVAEDAAGHG